MPQMSPIYWLILLIYFIIMMLVLMMFIYFLFYPLKSSKFYMIKKEDSLIWKW